MNGVCFLNMTVWLLCFRFMNTRAAVNCRYQPTCYEHAANCYTHAVTNLHSLMNSIKELHPSVYLQAYEMLISS